jgi:hypothetical protein
VVTNPACRQALINPWQGLINEDNIQGLVWLSILHAYSVMNVCGHTVPDYDALSSDELTLYEARDPSGYILRGSSMLADMDHRPSWCFLNDIVCDLIVE